MIKQELINSISSMPDFSLYLIMAFTLSLAFIAIYVRVTPYKEMDLIRQGNSAAALSLGGAILGFVLPLSAVVRHSAGIVDLVAWSVVAALVQMAAYAAVRIMVKELARGIEANCIGHGLFLGIASIASGILTAACITP
ncbi:DUF350 domain-containing protein [Mariprofundus erugo]|uniref:DUF350 domain-containing protein n=1 Tax=Mariprofundus erugo TaxID=2528639 RepID=A0A5R9GFI4_9PROT|nr:DUF350 domain-containing protein [Mariprofundus erugo]TLS65736.1 DUF350 domain-containing protein [Mariprofundus erugo]